ncbi:Hypothetical Protein FCC1311_083612 [Hondaea fermentalgiana]|uniref:Uncharacterized protein n=1 Tax=Hondaea fermentalgiana TaxID=2315210 RepID=A0A2R5GMM6_9STRA|nr:Hypothetical Protein FCC1311_083612 [Hondaea fermentalgiana]|eukprot:GBG32136.1 Hypothetical Protein FCC1311_083612 [Hondaea fermentalgiana]
MRGSWIAGMLKNDPVDLHLVAQITKEEHQREVEAEEKVELELLNARDAALEEHERHQVAARRLRDRETMLQNQRLARARVEARAKAHEAQILVEQRLLEREEFERKFGQSIC